MELDIDDTLTVEYSRRPGSALLRKVINSFQIQTHTMYFDTSFNSMGTVIRNIYHAFVESAMKFHRYVKSLRRMKTIGQMQLVVCIKELLELAWVMVRSRQGEKAVTRGNVIWSVAAVFVSFACVLTLYRLGAHAFRKVLARKQSGYQLLLKWLEDAEKADGRRPAGSSGLSLGAFESYRY